jgi:formylglycine-generating enzyme required for sulfatase activity
MWGEFLSVNYPKIIYQGFDFIANVLTGDSTEDAIANLNQLSNGCIKAANDIRASTFDHWIIQEDYSNFIRWFNSIDAADTTFTNTIGMEFVLIPAGEFDMGSPSDEEGRWSGEGPVHHVTIEDPFYMGKSEVTQAQWRAVMGDNPSFFSGDDDLPVETVSWDDVQSFITKLNDKEGTNKYRLPSEAEWEYACRAGTTTRYSFGDSESELGDYAWYYDNSGGQTHPVGQKKANSWGLYDMHGNVYEWVQDCWHSDYNGAPTDGSAWVVACELGYYGVSRVFRGGYWHFSARSCRSACRRHVDPRDRDFILGFRLLQEV